MSSFAPRIQDETAYAVRLRKVARHVDDLIRGLADGTETSARDIEDALNTYARAIRPWAERAGALMVTGIDNRAATAIADALKGLSHADLAQESLRLDTRVLLGQRLRQQVALIQSIPLLSAERVIYVTSKANATNTKNTRVAALVAQTGPIAIRRASLIAGTEVRTTMTECVSRRALSVGSDGYIWRTEQDARVRRSHRAMEGKFVPWLSEPTLEDGTKGHAGCQPGCRCHPEPVLRGRRFIAK